MADVRVEADRILKATADLRELRKRLAELDAERAALEKTIQDRMAQLGMGESLDPGDNPTLADRILAFMKRNPTTVYGAPDFAREWRMKDISSLRSAFRRLHDRGKVTRLSYGRYILKGRRSS